jgi:hypothetical protein
LKKVNIVLAKMANFCILKDQNASKNKSKSRHHQNCQHLLILALY